MSKIPWTLVAWAVCWLAGPTVAADAPVARAAPDPVPLTRDAMKRALDASKESLPRLPLPPLTDAEREFIAEQHAAAARSGEQPRRFGLANNGRMRAYYLADYGFQNDFEQARAGTSRQADASFDPNFRTMLFWIVSRGNNCTYCLGHQESGLATRGVSDDELAALDGDWSQFDEAHRAAFAFAAKLSFEPYDIGDEDVVALRKHFDESQVGQLVAAVAGFNATNRWTGPLRIKQDVLFQFVRPTSTTFAAQVSKIAPAGGAGSARDFAAPRSRLRPPLETREELSAALDAARHRTPRLALAGAAETQAALSDQAGEAPPAQWMRLLAAGPKSSVERIASYRAALEKGTLDPRHKALIAYIGARHDRAWYALGHAIARLQGLGAGEDEIFALDRPEQLASPVDREIALFTRKVTVDPALIDDDDFARLRRLMDDRQVAEVVYQGTQAAFFDRLTEAAGLQLEN